ESIIETGQLLVAAQEALGKYGKGWGRLLYYLPFGESQARMLMCIARHPVLSNQQYVVDLPASWATLYELSGMHPGKVEALIKEGAIHPRITRREAKALCTATQHTAMQDAYNLLCNLFLFMSYTTPQEYFDHQGSLTIAGSTKEIRQIAAWI